VAVTAKAYADDTAWFKDTGGWTHTIPANGTATLIVFGDAGDEYSVEFTASGYAASDNYAYVTAPSSGGQT
jgi:hypothetical protein